VGFYFDSDKNISDTADKIKSPDRLLPPSGPIDKIRTLIVSKTNTLGWSEPKLPAEFQYIKLGHYFRSLAPEILMLLPHGRANT
jgi:hypothetical protein